jgi:hypothetical protein
MVWEVAYYVLVVDPKWRDRGPSGAEYLLIACLNPCVSQCSKAKMGETQPPYNTPGDHVRSYTLIGVRKVHTKA